MKIHKYPFPGEERQITILLPDDAIVVHVAIDNKTGIPTIWAMFDETADQLFSERTFSLVATGESYDGSKLYYFDTFQQGPFVWHLFEHA